eukprot:scaffold80600_cov68-Attheya_sp.AAC.1
MLRFLVKEWNADGGRLYLRGQEVLAGSDSHPDPLILLLLPQVYAGIFILGCKCFVNLRQIWILQANRGHGSVHVQEGANRRKTRQEKCKPEKQLTKFDSLLSTDTTNVKEAYKAQGEKHQSRSVHPAELADDNNDENGIDNEGVDIGNMEQIQLSHRGSHQEMTYLDYEVNRFIAEGTSTYAQHSPMRESYFLLVLFLECQLPFPLHVSMPIQGWEGGQTNNQQSAQSSNFKLPNLLQQNNDPTGTFGTRLAFLSQY